MSIFDSLFFNKQAEIDRLNKEITSLNNHIDTLKEENLKYKTMISSLQFACSYLTNANNFLDQSSTNLSSGYISDSSQKKTRQINSIITRIQMIISQFKENIDCAKTARMCLKDEIKKLEESLTQKQNELNNLL